MNFVTTELLARLVDSDMQCSQYPGWDRQRFTETSGQPGALPPSIELY